MPDQAESEFALVKEKLDPALKLSGQPVKRGTMAHEHIVYMMLVDSAARAGDETGIRRYVSHLEELATQDDHRPYLAVGHPGWPVLQAGKHRIEYRFHRLPGLLSRLTSCKRYAREPWCPA